MMQAAVLRRIASPRHVVCILLISCVVLALEGFFAAAEDGREIGIFFAAAAEDG